VSSGRDLARLVGAAVLVALGTGLQATGAFGPAVPPRGDQFVVRGTVVERLDELTVELRPVAIGPNVVALVPAGAAVREGDEVVLVGVMMGGKASMDAEVDGAVGGDRPARPGSAVFVAQDVTVLTLE